MIYDLFHAISNFIVILLIEGKGESVVPSAGKASIDTLIVPHWLADIPEYIKESNFNLIIFG